MPYAVRRHQGKWSVVNPQTGRVYGTHDTKQEAEAQLAAMYVHADPAEEKGAEVRTLVAWPSATQTRVKG